MKRVLAGFAIALFIACGGSSSSSEDDDGGGGSGGDFLGGCRSHDDCTKPGESCFAVGDPNCGACFDDPYPCTVDDDCSALLGAGYVCGPTSAVGPCSCPSQPGGCVPACSDASDCEAAEACNAALCEPIPCTSASDCGDPALACTDGGMCTLPACQSAADCEDNMTCNGSFSCERIGCQSDADCAGFCVNGRCHESLGGCSEPAP